MPRLDASFNKWFLMLKLSNEKVILLFVLFFVALYIAFYPPFYGGFDDQQYLRGAYALAGGTLPITPNPLEAAGYVFVPSLNHYALQYPIGQSLLLLPFTFISWNSAFLANLVVLLIGTFVFYKLLKKLNFNTLNTLLFLFFPFFIFQSRTFSSELTSAVMILIAFYFYLGESRKQNALSGFFFGFATLIRYTNILAFIPFLIFSLIKNRRKAFSLIAGILPFAIIIPLYNLFVFGSPLAMGQTFSIRDPFLVAGMPNFSLLYLPEHLIIYILLLSAIYPLMFFAQFFFKNEAKWEIIGTTALFIAFFGSFFWLPLRTGFPNDLIFGIRYLAPIVPLYLIAYIPFYESILKRIKIPWKPVFAVAAILLIAGAIALTFYHHKFQQGRLETFNELYARTEDNSLIIEDISDNLSNAQMFIMESFPKRDYLDIGMQEGIDRDNIGKYISDAGNTYFVKLNYISSYKSELEVIPWLEYNAGGS